MKNFISVGLVLCATFSNFALADGYRSSQLRSTDGTEIYLVWSTQTVDDLQTGQGNVTAPTLSVSVMGRQSGSRAVLIDNCRTVSGQSYQNVAQCDLVPQYNSTGIQSACSFANVFLSTTFEGSGMQTECFQQIAIVMQDGSWLVDPMNGSHNFNFSLN
jgi:hypothetical protein